VAVEGKKQKPSRLEYMRMLAESGYSDAVILRRETASEVLTDERMRIVDTLRDEEVESMTELSDVLEREKSAVKRDLDVLFKYDIVEYEKEGRKKAPSLKHAHIFVEPVV